MSQTQISPPLTPLSTGTPRRGSWLFKLWDTSGMLLVLIVLFVLAAANIRNFASGTNMVGLLLSVTTTAFVACTMMLCLAGGDFDLSVGSTMAMSGMVCVLVIRRESAPDSLAAGAGLWISHHLSWLLTIDAGHAAATISIIFGTVCALAAGGAVGFVNGVLITKANINALIATLCTMQQVRSLSFLSSDGRAVGLYNDKFVALGTTSFPQFHSYYLTWAFDWHRGFPWISGSFWWTYGEFRGLPLPIWVMFAFFVVFAIILTKTTFGRNTLAIGGNKEAARLAGIAVDRTKIIIFTLQGIAAAFAGIILAARLTSGQPGNGVGLELKAIAACVLGGVSLTGGVATMSGVIIGLLILGMVENAMNMLNISVFWQPFVNGSVLMAAVLLDSLKQRLKR